MPRLQMDSDGYPTDKTLKAVRSWPYDKAAELMEELRRIWKYEDYFTQDEEMPGLYHVSTGGWSGHESLIETMQENIMVWGQVWLAERRGGHYILCNGYACFGGTADHYDVRFSVSPKPAWAAPRSVS